MAEQEKMPALAPCADYAPETVRSALEAVIAAAGGLDWVRPGMRIGVKLNLCTPRRLGLLLAGRVSAASAVRSFARPAR